MTLRKKSHIGKGGIFLNYEDYEYLKDFTRNKFEIESTFIVIKEMGPVKIGTIEKEVKKMVETIYPTLIPPKDYDLDSNNNRSKFSYNLTWARTYLKKNKIIINKKRGVWQVTDTGNKMKSVYLKKEDELTFFRLEKLFVMSGNKQLFDIDFCANIDKSKSRSYYSIIIGENGTKKSLLLRVLTQIYLVISKSQEGIDINRNSDIDFDYCKFSYVINDNRYEVTIDNRDSLQIMCFKNKHSINILNVVLPQKMLAISSVVDDKFMYASNEKYKYLGGRTSANGNFIGGLNNRYVNMIDQFDNEEEIKQALEHFGFVDFTTEKKLSKESPSNRNLYFTKKGSKDLVKFSDLSTGEKSIIGLVLSLVILSKNNSSNIILIDEPETSLHPNWQLIMMEKLENIISSKKMFSHVIIATHSPNIISSSLNSKTTVIKSERSALSEEIKYEIVNFSPSAWSIENILYNIFHVNTYRNYYVDRDMQEVIAYISNKSLSYENASNALERLKSIEFIDEKSDPLAFFIEKASKILGELEK